MRVVAIRIHAIEIANEGKSFLVVREDVLIMVILRHDSLAYSPASIDNQVGSSHVGGGIAGQKLKSSYIVVRASHAA